MSNVTVEINGRETVSKAAIEAKNGIAGVSAEAQKAQGAASGLSSETKKLDGMFGGFVITAGDVVNAVKAVAEAAWSTVQAFAEQEKSLAQFSAAMSLSGKITSKEAEGLRQYAEEIANLTGEDDEAILSMEAFLSASGRNEAQIRKLIAAAADYSAATGKDMRTAVEELNKTFSGTEGRMGQLIPALKDLTDEQLKSGIGIDIVAEQYKGFAEQMSGIADVDLKNFKNAYDDVIAAIGKEVWPAIQPALENVTKFMREKLIPGIGEFFNVTVAIFENIPEIAKRTFQLINDIIRITFSWDGISAILISLGENIVNAFSSAFSILPDMFLNIIGLMFNPIRQLGLYIGDTLGKAFSGKLKEIESPGDFLASLITMQAEAVGNIAKDAKDLFVARFNSTVSMAAEIGDVYKSEFNRFWADVMKVIQPTLNQIATATVVPLAAAGGGGGGGAEVFTAPIGAVFGGDVFSSGGVLTGATLADVISKEDQDFYDKLTGYLYNGIPMRDDTSYGREVLSPGGQLSGGTLADIVSPEDQAFYDKVTGYLGELVQMRDDTKYGGDVFGVSNMGQSSDALVAEALYLAANQYGSVERSGILEKIGGALTPVIDGFLGMVTPLASVQAILNPLQTIFSAMMEVLGPLINTVLQPIVGILRIVGQVLGAVLAPVISILGPIIRTVAEGFVWLYNNAIRPVANAFIWVGNAIYNAVVWVINKIRSIFGGEQLATRSMNAGALATIDLSTVTSAGATTPAGGGTYGGSATYQKPRDITMYFTINTPAMIGDGGFTQFCQTVKREFASMGVINMVEA